jgi:hypothetical protein
MALPTNLADTRFVNKVYANTQSNLIEITEDKLKIILIDFIVRVRKSQDWLIPFSIFLTLLITFLTTDFSKDFLAIPKTIWAILFELVFIASIIWLIISLYQSFSNRKSIKIDNLLEIIKNEN